MRAVLGIDAAWTAGNPSGLALVVDTRDGWILLVVAESYAAFHKLAHDQDWHGTSSLPPASILLQSASLLVGRPVDIVAVDMPLAATPIIQRRVSDNEVSREYGSRQCSTHSPSVTRPGKISDVLRSGFSETGYPLSTLHLDVPALIEVYPHPALVELARAQKRLPYKAANIRKYWREETTERRRELLFEEWTKIVALLDNQISGVAEALPKPDLASSSRQLRAYEDMLDAVVCAWVGICALEGKARPLGDSESAIWVPSPVKD